MKMFTGLLMCAAVGFFVFLYSVGFMADIRFYSNAVPVTMIIDHVSAVEKNAPRAAKMSRAYCWDIEIRAHYDSKQKTFRRNCRNASEAKLLVASQGKSLVLWVLPYSKDDTYYRFKNDFPIGSLSFLIVSVVIFFGGLYVVLATN